MESFTSPDPLTRAELTIAEGWGNQDLGQRLAFGPAGKMLCNVVVHGTRMYLGRVIERSVRAEQPIEAIRELVLKKWTTFRAGELTLERANGLVAALAEKPAEHPEDEPWNPVVELEVFQKALGDAGLTVVERPWLEQRELPADAGPVPTGANRFFQNEALEYYELPVGAVGAPKRSQTGDAVYIVRHSGERPKPTSELTANDLSTLPMMVRYEARTELAEKAFQGDSEWFLSRFKVRFPERERRDAENAATEEAPEPGT
jgi:hypothetical protein